MSFNNNPTIVKDGLIFLLDSSNEKSFPNRTGSNQPWTDLIQGKVRTAVEGADFTFEEDPYTAVDNTGVGAYNYGPTVDIIGNSDSYTLGVWVNFTQTNRGYITNAKRTNGFSSLFGLVVNYEDNTNGINEPGTLGIIYSIGGSGGNNGAGHYFVCTEDENYNDGNWHYLVGTFGIDRVEVYVDGIKKNERTSDGLESRRGTGEYSVGSFGNNNVTTSFIGKINKIELYNKVLSQEEIKQNYNNFKGRFGL